MNTGMSYNRAGEQILEEASFDASSLGKCEAVMSLGNGYMGLRSALEEKYLKERRGLFIAGTFNRADAGEVSELPNAADVTAVELWLDGEVFSLETGTTESCRRSLNLKTGELTRNVIWISPGGKKYELHFRRIVSMRNRHLIAQKISLRSLDGDVRFRLRTGIDGQITNHGAQHFMERQKRFYEGSYMQYVTQTNQSGITFVETAGVGHAGEAAIGMGRRWVYADYEGTLKTGKKTTVEKISHIATDRDLEYRDLTLEALQEASLEEVKKGLDTGYDTLARESAAAWQESVWSKGEIQIESSEPRDNLAAAFAQYHLAVMTPAQDARMSVGAKGLSGEGYKGHAFWDTEIFVLPYFTFTFPETAKKLLEYRYLGLKGAREKAEKNGCEGAQFPWESAWYEDGEVTPPYGDVDIVTGEPQKIWSGLIEQHITSDVVYGVWQYYQASGDEAFMEECGYEIIFDTARFWASRAELLDDGYYHIRDVIGPDEYKEHVDDNAYTNYMACWNLELAVSCYQSLEKENNTLLEKLVRKLLLTGCPKEWVEKRKKWYLPAPNERGVIPQDSTYFSLKQIDLTKYREQDGVLGIYRDYNAEQINGLQVSKQADALLLLLLQGDAFSRETKEANWNYYEPRTLHDSSLSLSTHCILACELGKREEAYRFFKKAWGIDLGPYMKSSDDGIHAASIGGLWQSVIFGFAGLRLTDGVLQLEPKLPGHWSSLDFSVVYRGVRLKIHLTQEEITVKELSGGPVELRIGENSYILKEPASVSYKGMQKK